MSAALARKRWMQVSKKEKQRKRWEAMAAPILKNRREREELDEATRCQPH